MDNPSHIVCHHEDKIVGVWLYKQSIEVHAMHLITATINRSLIKQTGVMTEWDISTGKAIMQYKVSHMHM